MKPEFIESLVSWGVAVITTFGLLFFSFWAASHKDSDDD